MGRTLFVFFFLVLLNSQESAAQLRLQPIPDSGTRNLSLRILPQNFYSKHQAFVCKKEVELQKLTALPIYIRLGSKDYVDYLEKKPNSKISSN